MMDGWSMGGWMWLWFFFAAVGLLILGYVAVRLAQTGRGSSESTPGPPSARRILDERYARGEIDDEEYRRRRAELP
jgi:putative membrane protein